MNSSKSSVENLYTNWNDDLYQRYIKLFPEGEHTTIWDGVVNPTAYAASPLKIMFLNREGYDEEGNDYDVTEALLTAINDEQRIFPNQTTMRTHLKQYLLVLRQLESGMLHNTSDDQMSEIISQNTSNEKWFNSQIAKVAYCNVKKSDGQPKSNVNDLYNYAKKGIDILKEQIRFFNPTIILAGDVCDNILENLVDWGDNLYVPEGEHRICIWQLKIDRKCYPFVDMYHPSRTQGMSDYYLTFLHALQAVEEKMPNFWKERLNQRCFNMNSAIIEEKPRVKTETYNEAEILFEQAQRAAGMKDWKTAVRLYYEAAQKNYAPAFRELGRFFEDVYYQLDIDEWDYYNKYDDSKKLDDWIPTEEYYYQKAAELGDEECQFSFVEENLEKISPSYRAGALTAMFFKHPFSFKKRKKQYIEKAQKALKYFDHLIEHNYRPAIEKLNELKEIASDTSDRGNQDVASEIINLLNKD